MPYVSYCIHKLVLASKYKFIMKKYLATLSAFALPVVAFAQVNTTPPSGGQGLIDNVGTSAFRIANLIANLVNFLTPVVVGLALLAFFWGLFLYIYRPTDLKAGRDYMIGGIVALFVMVSIWGIVNFLGNTLGISTGGEANIPCAVDNTPNDPSRC